MGVALLLDVQVAVVTRLTHQKGIHLIKHAAWRTLGQGGQFVLLGSAPDPRVQVGKSIGLFLQPVLANTLGTLNKVLIEGCWGRTDRQQVIEVKRPRTCCA